MPFQMAKHKIKCDLNDFIIGYLKKFKHEKSLRILDAKKQVKNDHKAAFEQFYNYLTKKDIQKEDDLGFKINLEAYQKQSTLQHSLRKVRNLTKIEKSEKHLDIPIEFITKIEELGMRKKDAEILYKSQIDWVAVYIENKIYCIEPRCEYFTHIDNEDLRSHMINVHKYGQYPCLYTDCDYVAFSNKNLNFHTTVHTMRYDKEYWHKCPRLNCRSSFEFRTDFERHIRIHRNEFSQCQYCPFRYNRQMHYQSHLKSHFRIKDFKCDQCDKSFNTVYQLNRHYSMHEGIIYHCLICVDYKASRKDTMLMHIRNKHEDVFGKNIHWDTVKTFKTK